MNRATLQAAFVVLSALITFIAVVVDLHWHHGEVEMDHKGDVLPVDDLD